MDYVVAAVRFVARHAWKLRYFYRYDGRGFVHVDTATKLPPGSVSAALMRPGWYQEPALYKRGLYARYLAEAADLVSKLWVGEEAEEGLEGAGWDGADVAGA